MLEVPSGANKWLLSIDRDQKQRQVNRPLELDSEELVCSIPQNRRLSPRPSDVSLLNDDQVHAFVRAIVHIRTR